jgi:hypothetical protein
LWLVHPAARALLPLAVRLGVSANAVSIAGLAVGILAAMAYAQWAQPAMVLVGLLLGIAWLICDGLDGMIARATGTASPIGRVLDGICDHGVFVAIYVLLAISIGQPVGWVLACTAGLAHAVQSSLYEGERARFHRRVRGDAAPLHHVDLGSALVRTYDSVAGSIDRLAARFDEAMRTARDPQAFGRDYGRAAAPAMKVMSLLSANVRLLAITAACLARAPLWFWWFEIVPLSLLAAATLAWHRHIENRFVDDPPTASGLGAGA